jgi:hypothetical protein
VVFRNPGQRGFVAFALACAATLGGAGTGLLAICGPFTDVSDAPFCPFILELFTLAITTGTTPTTYDPSSNVSRLQMAAFLSRTVDRTLQRGGRRAALNQYWTPQNAVSLALTTVGGSPEWVQSDGDDLWVTNYSPGTVSRIRGSDGRRLETWTGAGNTSGAAAVIVAMGRVVVTGDLTPAGRLYSIDPSQPAGAVTTVATNLGPRPVGIAFDGSRFWTANVGPSGSVSIVTPGAVIPWTVTTVTAGFSASFGPVGVAWDGSSAWTTDYTAGTLLRLGIGGEILQTVTVGDVPQTPVFDGTNIWVPNAISNSVSIVRAASGAVLATLTGNGLNSPVVAAFDGQRVLVTNFSGDSVSLWKAADLSSIGTFSVGVAAHPAGACSDGVNFWIVFNGAGKLARF